MKAIFFLILFFPLVCCLPACKEVPKTTPPSGIRLMIHDLPCEEVLERMQKILKQQNYLSEWIDRDRGLLKIGPIITQPLPTDPFLKIEEKIFLEIKCLDPLSTRMALQLELKGLSTDNRWIEIKEADKLNAYGKRFLDMLIIR